MTLFALVALVVIVVSGAAVRLSGSGLGCTDWPTCEEGRLAPESVSEANAMIEFANRAFTGVVSAAVALAVLGALRRRPRRGDLTTLAVGLVIGVAGQAVLGGMVVWYGLSPWLSSTTGPGPPPAPPTRSWGAPRRWWAGWWRPAPPWWW